jgi:hypothetical protein
VTGRFCGARRTLPAVQIPPVGGLGCCGRRLLPVGNSRGRESHQQLSWLRWRRCGCAFHRRRAIATGRSATGRARALSGTAAAVVWDSRGGLVFQRMLWDAAGWRDFSEGRAAGGGRSNPARIEWNERRGFNEAVRDTGCSARLTAANSFRMAAQGNARSQAMALPQCRTHDRMTSSMMPTIERARGKSP